MRKGASAPFFIACTFAGLNGGLAVIAMRIALAQINTVVGDVEGNLRKILAYAHRAHQKGASVVVFPELALCGYPPLDLLYRADFIRRCEEGLRQLVARLPSGLGVLVGGIRRNPKPVGRPLFNTAFYIEDGRVRTYDKHLLPSYDVFDECRYYEPGSGLLMIERDGERIGVTICEDIWHVIPELRYAASPMDALAAGGASVVVNLSASPFTTTHDAVRQTVLRRNIERYRLPVLYVNQVGGQTHLLFDGATRAVNIDGKVGAQAPPFTEHLLIVEKTSAGWVGAVHPYPTDKGELLFRSLTMALRDYFQKLELSPRAVLGLSGGIDSAVVLALAVEALGKEAVTPIFLPSRFTSQTTYRLVDDLARRIGISYETLPIDNHFERILHDLEARWTTLPADVTEENIQARLRQVLIMAYANKMRGVMLNTSNKSELAVGYGTLYGDLAGGVSVIGDVWKTQVYDLARTINARHGWIPDEIITRPPSAELKPDQRDTDTLPPYPVLDPILHLLIEKEQSAREVIAQGFDASTVYRVLRMVRSSEYKRYQFPNIFRVSERAFGYGRRVPIVAQWE